MFQTIESIQYKQALAIAKGTSQVKLYKELALETLNSDDGVQDYVCFINLRLLACHCICQNSSQRKTILTIHD